MKVEEYKNIVNEMKKSISKLKADRSVRPDYQVIKAHIPDMELLIEAREDKSIGDDVGETGNPVCRELACLTLVYEFWHLPFGPKIFKDYYDMAVNVAQDRVSNGEKMDPQSFYEAVVRRAGL